MRGGKEGAGKIMEGKMGRGGLEQMKKNRGRGYAKGHILELWVNRIN